MKKINVYPKKILIVGNGFDLNQGLKTGYCDFIKSEDFVTLLSENSLAYHLKEKHELVNWIDIENELTDYSLKRVSPNEAHILKKEFSDISNALMNYLKSINYCNIHKEKESYKLIAKIIEEDFLIIDFNYTNTIKEILKNLGISDNQITERLIKIHGSLDEGDIVFGIEDAARIREEFVFLFKAYSKQFKGISFDEQLTRAEELYVFGHSLGQTDHMYFDNFFTVSSMIHNIDSGKKIYLYYYGDDGYHQLHKQLYKLTNKKLSGFKQVNDLEQIDVSKL